MREGITRQQAAPDLLASLGFECLIPIKPRRLRAIALIIQMADRSRSDSDRSMER